MKTLKFYQLDGEQKLDAITKMVYIIAENNLQLPTDEERLKIELEQGYGVDADFTFKVFENDELIVELKEFV